MLIRYQALQPHLQKHLKAMYVLQGSDQYLLNEAALSIKKIWHQRGETDEKIIDINTPADWKQLIDETSSYSLFSEFVLIDVRFDKKSIDSSGKEVIIRYLKNINAKYLILLRANHLSAKQHQWLHGNELVVFVEVPFYTEHEQKKWIAKQLETHRLDVDPSVPELIHLYTQKNTMASAQVIEKLSLIFDQTTKITVDAVKEQLVDQSDLPLYELSDACLTANRAKALHLLKQAFNDRTEPTLILWLITQDIRQLIELSHLLSQSTAFSVACSQLKIWPKRASYYKQALLRLPLTKLYPLLIKCSGLDECIKTHLNTPISHALEKIVLSLCDT